MSTCPTSYKWKNNLPFYLFSFLSFHLTCMFSVDCNGQFLLQLRCRIALPPIWSPPAHFCFPFTTRRHLWIWHSVVARLVVIDTSIVRLQVATRLWASCSHTRAIPPSSSSIQQVGIGQWTATLCVWEGNRRLWHRTGRTL